MHSVLRSVSSVIVIALIALPGCRSGTDIEYVTNARLLLDTMQKATEAAAGQLPKISGARVAIIDLEGTNHDGAYPAAITYDMLAIALAKQRIAVAERDVEALYHTLIEGWSDKLPFYVSPQCGTRCPEAPAPCDTAESDEDDDGRKKRKKGKKGDADDEGAQGKKGKKGKKAAAAACGGSSACGCGQGGVVVNVGDNAVTNSSAGEAAAAPASADGSDNEKEAEAPKAPELSAVYKPVPRARNDYTNLFVLNMPQWFKKNGDKIIAEKAAATMILGFRLLTYGVSLEPMKDENLYRRVVRVDLLLRLIDAKHGVVVWSDRIQLEEKSTVPAEIVGRLTEPRFEYQKPQHKGREESSGGGLGGLFGN